MPSWLEQGQLCLLQSIKNVRNKGLLFALINSTILFVRVKGIMIDVDIKKHKQK